MRGDTKALIEASRIQTTGDINLEADKTMDITAYTVAAGATFDGGAIEASISLNDIEGDVSASLIDSNGSFAITSGGSVKLKAKDNSNVSAYGGGASGASRKKDTTGNGGATGGTAGALGFGISINTHSGTVSTRIVRSEIIATSAIEAKAEQSANMESINHWLCSGIFKL